MRITQGVMILRRRTHKKQKRGQRHLKEWLYVLISLANIKVKKDVQENYNKNNKAKRANRVKLKNKTIRIYIFLRRLSLK